MTINLDGLLKEAVFMSSSHPVTNMTAIPLRVGGTA